MATLQSVATAFTENGTEVPQNLLPKCMEICNQLNISAEDLASQYEAFTLNQKSMKVKSSCETCNDST
jgi:hypothetical protein